MTPGEASTAAHPVLRADVTVTRGEHRVAALVLRDGETLARVRAVSFSVK